MVVRASAKYRNLPVPSAAVWQQQVRLVLAEVKKNGKDTFEITDSAPVYWGHVNQPLSDHLVRAANEGWHMYSSKCPWRAELPKAISEFEKRYRNVDYSVDDIIPTPGAGSAWTTIHYTMLDSLDDVMVVEPAHYMWSPAPVLPIFSTRILTSPSREDDEWQPDLEELRKRMTDKTKFIAIDNPNNPTAAIYSEKVLKGIVDIAGEYEVPIISDEIYGLITYDGVKSKSIAEVSGDVPTIVINGMTKFFMRPGWRVGYLAFHDPKNKMVEVKNVTRKFSMLYGHPGTGIPTPILAAATWSFRGSMEGGWQFVRNLQSRRDFTFKRVNEIEGMSCVKPRGALYAFPRLHHTKAWKTDEEFMMQLAKEEGITFLPGSFYGPSGDWHFRTLLLPEIRILEEVYNRLERFIKRHAT